MQRVFNFLLSAIALLLLVVSCDNESLSSNPPVLKLEKSNIKVSGSGGRNIIGYTVENGVRGRKPVAQSDVEWIYDIVVTDSHIDFMVGESDVNEERYGRIIISYEGMEYNSSINVTQDKMPLNSFAITIEDVTFNSCSVTYTPVDNEILYIASVIDKEYFSSSGISTEEAFLDAELGYYISVAESYGRTLEELIPAANLGGKGELKRTYSDMQPGATYVVYCYGIEVNGNDYHLITPIHYYLLKLPMPDMYEVDFDASIAVNGSYVATISMSPKNWNGYYYVQIAPESSLYYVEEGNAPADYIVRGMGNSFYNQARSYMSKGESADKFLKSICYSGSRQITVQLEGGQRYMLILFAVESTDGSIPVMRSMPEFFYFETK